MLARRSGSHLRSFQWHCPCQDLDLEKFSPELTEEPACLEERVESWTGTVLQTRPTRRTGVTLDLLFQYFALSQLKIWSWRFGKNLTKMEKKTKEKKKPCREVKISWVEGLRDLSFVFKHSYPPHCSCLHLTMCSPQNHWLILWPPRQPGWSPCRRSPHQAVLEKLTPSLLQTTTLKMFQSKKIDN